MKKAILILITYMFCMAQQPVIEISGTVTDESGSALPGISVVEKGTTNGTITDITGAYNLKVSSTKSILEFSFVGYITQSIAVDGKSIINMSMAPDVTSLEEVVVTGYAAEMKSATTGSVIKIRGNASVIRQKSALKSNSQPSLAPMNVTYDQMIVMYMNETNDEDYAGFEENTFQKPLDHPLSTFSIDVDAASYSNVRRFLNNGQKPPKDAIRIEEMVNYFDYNYPQPTGKDPFSITTNYMPAPWNKEHLLVQIGLQGKKIAEENLPASNIVFLLDVSGSMNDANKLPLLKSSLKMLTNKLRPVDKVSIVVYAGAAGTVLEPTPGDNKQKIMNALDQLSAGGSTAGGEGIRLAYKIAKEQFIEGGNNRVILATDGDFNVGASSNEDMEKLIEEKRKDGIFLTVLGFGMGNYKDSKMEILADKGNGNYAYIDNLKEAQKVLVNEFGGTLFTIAKDVKIQVEFNPAKVQAYRLIGYENRKLNAEDFNNDKNDAGELGSGHTVTALYEIVPVGVKSNYAGSVDPLKYQKQLNPVVSDAANGDEILTVKFRYKKPDSDTSELITKTVTHSSENLKDENLNWAASVAGFGMLLKDSDYVQNFTYEDVLALCKNTKGSDEYGYRSEFIQLVRLASNMVQ